MTTNKYLSYITKSAGLGSSVMDYLGRVSGHTASKLKNEAEILSRAQALGRTAQQATIEADQAAKATNLSRLHTGASLLVGSGAGFLGVHKYHQHKDDAIMKQLDSMYQQPTT